MTVDFGELLTNDEDKKTYKYFCGGEWLESKSGLLISVNSPIDGSVVGRIGSLTKTEIDACITSASLAQPAWERVALARRIEILKKAAKLLLENIEKFCDLLSYEIGKTKNDAKSEILHSCDFLNFIAKRTEWGKIEKISGRLFPKASNKTCFLYKVPYGVIAAITPFNFPVFLPVTKIAPALLTGNSIVLKPATQGSITTLHLCQIFKEAGVPDGILNCITGKGREIGDFIVTHPLTDMLCFSGSTAVGKELATKAGLIPLFFELGGKDAAIVLSDADIDLAAREIANGAFSFSGQKCTAIKRVLVMEEIAEEFLDALKSETERNFKILGDPRLPETQLGPVISDEQVNYLLELLEDAKEKGAVEILGGAVFQRYIPATILDQVTSEMKIFWEEQFGPILPIIRVKDIIEAIDIHNSSQYGLGGAVFSENIDKAKEIALSLETGMVQINAKSSRWPDHFPFAGIGDSGVGVGGIDYTIESMLQLKSVIENKKI